LEDLISDAVAIDEFTRPVKAKLPAATLRMKFFRSIIYFYFFE
jgi:hypothetical protein